MKWGFKSIQTYHTIPMNIHHPPAIEIPHFWRPSHRPGDGERQLRRGLCLEKVRLRQAEGKKTEAITMRYNRYITRFLRCYRTLVNWATLRHSQTIIALKWTVPNPPSPPTMPRATIFLSHLGPNHRWGSGYSWTHKLTKVWSILESNALTM